MGTNGALYNLGTLHIKKIGQDKTNPPAFVTEVCDLMGFPEDVKSHFLQYSGFKRKKVDLLIGMKSPALLSQRVMAEQLGGHHHPTLSGITFVKTIISPIIAITGAPGLDPRITPPTLFLHKDHLTMADSGEATINRVELDEVWEMPRLIMDLDEKEVIEPVGIDMQEESNDGDTSVLITRMPEMLISVNRKYKNSKV